VPKNKNINVSNFHVQYFDVTSQHWNPSSARFAGADNLLTAMDQGWEISECVQVTHWYAGMRSVRIYEFQLHRGDEKMMMPVIDNPYVERFVIEEEIQMVVKNNPTN
jgi:hypothetical protein